MKRLTDQSTVSALEHNRLRIRRVTQLGLLLALALILSWLESLLPPPPVPLPIRYGISNVAVMYTLFFLDLPAALLLAVLKSGFVLFLRGPLAGGLSLAGGLLAVLGMGIVAYFGGRKASYLLLSIVGATLHNLGQFLVVRFLYVGAAFSVLYPLLLFAGLASGALTALLLRVLLPAVGRMELARRSRLIPVRDSSDRPDDGGGSQS